MPSRLGRSVAIFRLALSYWKDSRRINRVRRRAATAEEARRREEEILAQGGARFRETALSLGGLIIKVGQFLSARTDLLPLAFTRQLAELQDRVPPAPWDGVRALMEAEWNASLDSLFARIESVPVAAASLGQVHRAELPNGQAVAVKVQRPGISELADIDLGALSVIMRVLHRWTRAGRRINAVRLFDEFRGLVSRELDYRQEAQYLERFRENFSQVSEVVVPRDFPELTRRRVFVMEYLDGLKLDDPVALRQQGLDPVRLANIMIRAYLKQIAVDGFVQIDPHAGNFFADRQGRVIFLDFGMMAELPADDLGAVANLVSGILNRDGDQVVAAIDALGFVRPGTSRRLLKRAVRLMLDRLAGVELAPGPALDQAVADFQDFIYQEPLEFPARYMFLGRAIGMLFGLVSALYPDLDWMALLKAEALPLLAKRQSEGLPGWIRSLGDVTESVLGPAASLAVKTALAAGARTAVDLANTPGQLRRVLSLLEDGGLETVPELTPILRRLDRAYAMESAKLRLVWAGFFGAGAVTIHHFWPDAVWAVWLLGLAGLVALMASLAAQRRGRRLVRVRQAIPPFGDR